MCTNSWQCSSANSSTLWGSQGWKSLCFSPQSRKAITKQFSASKAHSLLAEHKLGLRRISGRLPLFGEVSGWDRNQGGSDLGLWRVVWHNIYTASHLLSDRYTPLYCRILENPHFTSFCTSFNSYSHQITESFIHSFHNQVYHNCRQCRTEKVSVTEGKSQTLLSPLPIHIILQGIDHLLSLDTYNTFEFECVANDAIL